MDEKFKKELFQFLDQQFEQRFIRLFNQGFEEVVRPELEAIRSEMATKKDIEGIKGQMESVNRRLDKHAEKIQQLEAA